MRIEVGDVVFGDLNITVRWDKDDGIVGRGAASTCAEVIRGSMSFLRTLMGRAKGIEEVYKDVHARLLFRDTYSNIANIPDRRNWLPRTYLDLRLIPACSFCYFTRSIA